MVIIFYKFIIFAFNFISFLHADMSSWPALTVNTDMDTTSYSLNVQVLLAFTALTLLPAIVMLMTSFTRIVIVLSILRQALGMPQVPSNQIVIGISLFLTIFIMAPIFNEINDHALEPFMEDKITEKEALNIAINYIKSFMLYQVRENDLLFFADLANETIDKEDDISFRVVMPAFVTSELKTAFQIGFIIFIPFLIIDLVVSSILMAMGMVMLSPLIVSLPFKIMLFVLLDGWQLITSTLVSSFGTV